MSLNSDDAYTRRSLAVSPSCLKPNQFSLSIYGDPASDVDDLLASIRQHGILVALVVSPGPEPGTWEVISGHRHFACATHAQSDSSSL